MALAFAAILAGALWLSSGIRNRSLSEILHGITNPKIESAAGSEPGGAPPPPSGSANSSSAAQTIVSFFERKGLTRAQAAGIAGNTMQESSDNPNAPGGGLVQGQGGRTSSGSLLEQLEGVWHELTTSERSSLVALRHTRTPGQAARVFSERFERPGIPALANRERYAQEAYAG